MNYSSPQLQSALAAEYVLGTLRGQARVRFQKLMKGHPLIERSVREWEVKFEALNSIGEPVVPPAGIITKIESRLFTETQLARVDKFNFWKFLGIGASVLSFGLATVIAALWMIQEPKLADEFHYISIFQDDQNKAVWTVDINLSTKLLSLTAQDVPAIDDDQDYELWLLPPNDQVPISLGLMPKNGNVKMPVDDLSYATSVGIAISLEPKGGSKTGAPTGPVLFVTQLLLHG